MEFVRGPVHPRYLELLQLMETHWHSRFSAIPRCLCAFQMTLAFKTWRPAHLTWALCKWFAQTTSHYSLEYFSDKLCFTQQSQDARNPNGAHWSSRETLRASLLAALASVPDDTKPLRLSCYAHMIPSRGLNLTLTELKPTPLENCLQVGGDQCSPVPNQWPVEKSEPALLTNGVVSPKRSE